MVRITWDEYFLKQAKLISMRAACPKASVGAVLTKHNQCVAACYNGSIAGLENCFDVGCKLEDGHCIRTIHAEMNALLHCARTNLSTSGCTMYITHFPCVNCMKHMVQAGIKRIVYIYDYKNNDYVYELAKLKNVDIVKGENLNVCN